MQSVKSEGSSTLSDKAVHSTLRPSPIGQTLKIETGDLNIFEKIKLQQCYLHVHIFI